MVFNAIFSYIVAVSFIGGGTQIIRRKPQTCPKSLTNYIIQCCIKNTSLWAGVELTTKVWRYQRGNQNP